MATSTARIDLTSQFEMGSGACQLGIADPVYFSPLHPTYFSHTFLPHRLLLLSTCLPPRPLLQQHFHCISSPSPPHTRLYIEPLTVHISNTPPVPALSTSTPYHSFTAGRRLAFALMYTLHLSLLLSHTITHHLTAKFAKKR